MLWRADALLATSRTISSYLTVSGRLSLAMSMGSWLKGRTKTIVIVTLSLGIGVATSAPVQSAVVYQITTDPTEPRVGQQVTIHVGTFLPDFAGSSGDPEPFPLDDFPWTFVADSPTGDRFVIPLTQLDGSDNQWVGNFVFNEVGRWEIGLDPQHLGTPIDPSLGARRETLVLGESSVVSEFLNGVIASFAILVLAIVVGWFLMRIRSDR